MQETAKRIHEEILGTENKNIRSTNKFKRALSVNIRRKKDKNVSFLDLVKNYNLQNF